MKYPDKVAFLVLLIAGFLYGLYLMDVAAWFPVLWGFLSLPSSQYVNGLLLSSACGILIVLDVWAIIDPNFLLVRWIRQHAYGRPTRLFRPTPKWKKIPRRRQK
jgi:hypothetical protein